MQIYNLQNEKLIALDEKPFKLEREIQVIFENNLQQVMGLSVVCSEFTIKNKRIDTLAYDSNTNAFIIIEYKRDKNSSVFDQGITYLNLMLTNKAEFVHELSNQQKSFKHKDEIDWSQSRVVFVSTSFNDNQIQASDFKDFAIELWEIKRFDKETILINPIKKSRTAESIKVLAQQNKQLKQITDEVIVYTEADHLDGVDENIVELYEKYRNAIINLADNFEISPQKYYIAFKTNKNIVGIEIQKKSLKIGIGAKMGMLNDSRQIMRDVRQIGHRVYGDYQIQVENDNDLEYILSLVKQVLLK